MPQFSDLSDHQSADIVRWIQYSRQRGQYMDLMAATDVGSGVVSDGKAYFEHKCGSCHSVQSDFNKKPERTRKSPAGGRSIIKKSQIRWLELNGSGENPSLGHGVQFRHDELSIRHVVAFLEGFNWLHQPGSLATVKVFTRCPSSISQDHWSEIIQSVREALLVFLSNEQILQHSSRVGPIHIIINSQN